MFGKKWEYGQARIVANQHRPTPRAGVLKYDYVADVTPDGGQPPFRATFTASFRSVQDWDVIPNVGDDVRVRFRAGGEDVNVDPDALDAKAKAIKDAAEQRFADAAAGAPTTPAPAAADPTAKLRELAELHASGVLTDAEFTSAKARVLGEL